MQNTKLSYLDDTYNFAALVNVQEIGSDEKGHFLIFDQTIYYPGGGGQPKDFAHLSFQNKTETAIIGADFNGGLVKHYIAGENPFKAGTQLAMMVAQEQRLLYATYHTVGHWIASIVCENIRLPFVPQKGYHYTDGAYIEFDGDKSLITDDILHDIDYAMRIDRQAQLGIKTEIINAVTDSERLKNAQIPDNFKPHPDKPLRLVTFDDYKSVPCGGTHLRSIKEIKSVSLSKIAVKNGKIRVSYGCEMWALAPV
ncbi:MAG: alanyl-tRNA synthetase [Bacteroidota bacterium]